MFKVLNQYTSSKIDAARKHVSLYNIRPKIFTLGERILSTQFQHALNKV